MSGIATIHEIRSRGNQQSFAFIDEKIPGAVDSNAGERLTIGKVMNRRKYIKKIKHVISFFNIQLVVM